MTKKWFYANIMNIFYAYSVIGVIAILSRAFSDVNVHLEWLIRENLTRFFVPIIFLIASCRFFTVSKNVPKAYFSLLKNGVPIYLMYTGIWILCKLWVLEFSSYGVKHVLQVFIAGRAPCTWMILAYIVGLGLVVLLRKLGLSQRSIIGISFLLYLSSISSEAYFHLFYDEGIVAACYKMYSHYFITTRNGLFYGFFWCAIGLASSNISLLTLKNVRKKMLFGAILFLVLMLGEHYYAYVQHWPRDYKSSFMLIPTSVCTFLFLLSFETHSLSEPYRFFRDWMFIAFMLIPSAWVMLKSICGDNSLLGFCCLSLVSLCCSYFAACSIPRLKFNLFNQTSSY